MVDIAHAVPTARKGPVGHNQPTLGPYGMAVYRCGPVRDQMWVTRNLH